MPDSFSELAEKYREEMLRMYSHQRPPMPPPPPRPPKPPEPPKPPVCPPCPPCAPPPPPEPPRPPRPQPRDFIPASADSEPELNLLLPDREDEPLEAELPEPAADEPSEPGTP